MHEIDLVSLLKSCARRKNLAKGTQLHAYINFKEGSWLRKNVYVGSALINMYAKCGDLENAQNIFDELLSRNVVSWNALIGGYVQQGYHEKGLLINANMRREGFCPNAVTFTFSLKACGSLGALKLGTQIHAELNISQEEFLMKTHTLGTSLVQMYAKCGSLSNAQKVFDEQPIQDVVTWTTLITGFCLSGHNEKALSCFYQMQHEGLHPDAPTFACVLKVCGRMASIQKANEMHAEISRAGIMEKDPVLGTAMVDMYAQCSEVGMARQVFDAITTRNAVSWTALVSAYSQNEHAEEAMKCLKRMECEGFLPDAITFICALKACGSIRSIGKGKEMHARAGDLLLHGEANLGTAVIDMYSQCGALAQAQRVFDNLNISERNVASWTTLIAGYSRHGCEECAIKCYINMQKDELVPDAATFASALKACGHSKAVALGMQIYERVKSAGLLDNNTVLCTAVIDMLAKCRAFAKAQCVIEELGIGNVEPWNALMAGLSSQGLVSEALKSFECMRKRNVSPDATTFRCVLKACAKVGALKKGNEIYAELVRHGLLDEEGLDSALVDMYVKCGALTKARDVFENSSDRDVVSWTALINGYAQNGHNQDAVYCFEAMQAEGLSPDGISLLSLLNAFSSLCFVKEGQALVDTLCKTCELSPLQEHYTCMVHLLSRSGHLDQAVHFIKKVSADGEDLALWFTLLGACREWGNIECGRLAFHHATKHLLSSGDPFCVP